MPSRRHRDRQALRDCAPKPQSAAAVSVRDADRRDDTLTRYRELLQKCDVEGWDHFDDLLFKVAAGALALSVTLLGVLDDRVAPASMKWAFFAWGFLGASLFLLLLSVLAAQFAVRKAIANIDKGTFYATDRPEGIFGALVNPLNGLAILFCFGGILCLMRFAGLNVT
jgi:hypothetical protein